MAKAKKAAPKKAAPKKGKKVEEAVTSEEESPPSPPAPASPAQGQSGAESDAEEEPVVKKGRGRPTSKAAAAPKKAAPSPKGKGKKAATPKRKSASKSKEPAAKSKPSGPAAKKSKPGAGASSGSEEDETDYEVERILEVQFLRNGKKEFLVQWKGFGKNGSTWEPEENLADCKGLLQAFMSKLENSDVPRSRRVSTRMATIQSTRASVGRQQEQRVKEGRIGKSRSQSRIPGNKSKKVLSLAEEVRRLNGEVAKEVKDTRLVSLESSGGQGRGRSLGRAALLTAGVTASIGAALLLTSPSTLNWDQLSQQVILSVQLLREKIMN